MPPTDKACMKSFANPEQGTEDDKGNLLTTKTNQPFSDKFAEKNMNNLRHMFNDKHVKMD